VVSKCRIFCIFASVSKSRVIFKKPSHFQKAELFSKSQLVPKKPSHLQKAAGKVLVSSPV
jgi:hypothetical protein